MNIKKYCIIVTPKSIELPSHHHDECVLSAMRPGPVAHQSVLCKVTQSRRIDGESLSKAATYRCLYYCLVCSPHTLSP